MNINLKCSRDFYGISEGITVQRSGKVIDTKSWYCGLRPSTTVRSCGTSVTYADPSGSQKWEVLVEWTNTYSAYGGGSTSGKQIISTWQ
ncbi:MAG: hypothetical protein QM572_04120 [Nocardioides sp.]|uniref:hypothetical protein n=1 Tax=Nocardioides sp. TaxID=35761 RepID=UPI0039E584C5